jgi:hypothetical protein
MDAHLHRRALLLSGAGLATTASLATFEPAAAGQTRTKVFTGHFTDPNGPDWVYLPFRVPKGVTRISVQYDYQPTPLGPTSFNVVDIGIFDPSGRGLGNAAGFRGWSGGARRSFSLSRTSATPGYLAGPITPGVWRVALGPYQIAGAGTPYRVEVTLHFGRRGPRFEPHPAPVAVPGRGTGWYRGDLHVHTVHSDGAQTQAEVIRYAKAAGLDFIGTSEHNTSSAQLTWGRYAPAGFLVIPGEEVTTRAGHWLATGLPAGTWIDWRYRPEDHHLKRFTDLVRSKGGLAIAAHPYQAGGGITWGFGYDFADVDAIEVWNGPWGFDDQSTVRQWHTLLSQGVFKAAVGNSDTHKQAQQIGLAQTVVRSASLSVRDLISGYRAGHSWIAESSAVGLDFTATSGAVTGECGDTVPSAAGEPVAVHLQVTGVPGCTAVLIGPGTGVTYGSAAATDGTITLDATVPGGTAFVRAEVRRGPLPTDPMVALTNPIFLNGAG